jgi:choline kinase
MKAIILAAGIGSRIQQVTRGLPKCLLQFGGRAILDFQIDGLFRAGITEAAIVIGHGKEHIVDHIAHRHGDTWDSISFITNHQFAVTNNIYSLWLAREWVGESAFICLNADVLCHPRILLPAVQTPADISVIIDREFRDETMKVIIREGQVLTIRKGISRQDFSGTYIGVTTFSQRGSQLLFSALSELIQEGRVHDFFQVAVERLIARGTPVRFTETGGLPWTEIDDPEDLRFAHTVVYPRLIEAAGVPGEHQLAQQEQRERPTPVAE